MRSTRNNSPGTVTPHSASRGHGSSLRELGAPLDQERAASMADEGGVAGAFTDALSHAALQPTQTSALVTTRTLRTIRKILPWALLASGVLGGLAIATIVWRNQRAR